MSTSTKTVYDCINDITAELAKVGIAKGRQNQQQHYAFRGIDDVYQALASLLAKHRLCILPRIVEHVTTERKTSGGKALFNVVVKVEFDFVASDNPGSVHTVVTIGEGIDMADKASNKAMSAAYKYACLQTFCIPVEGGSIDSETDDHEVAPKDDKPEVVVDVALKKKVQADIKAMGLWPKVQEEFGLEKPSEVYLPDNIGRIEKWIEAQKTIAKFDEDIPE